MHTDNHWQSMFRNFGSTVRAFASFATRLRIIVTALAILIVGVTAARQFRFYLLPVFAHQANGINANHVAVAAAAVSTVGLISLALLSRMILVKANVFNSAESLIFSSRYVPGFIQQDRHSTPLLEFCKYIEDILKVKDADSLSKAVALRHWVRCQQSEERAAWVTERAIDHEDPHLLLHQLRAGEPAACRRLSYTLLGALLSAGFDARLAVFASRLRRRQVLLHAVVEVWIEEMAQWVLLDPTYDCIVLINGKAASAMQLFLTIESGDLGCIMFERNGSLLEPFPKLDFLNECCRHLFLALSNAIFDGYGVRIIGPKRIDFLHYCPQGPKYPNLPKKILLGLSVACAALSIILWTLSIIVWHI